jgi:hypothetical protein
MAARKLPIQRMLIAVMLVAVAGLVVAYQLAVRDLVQGYYREEFGAESLASLSGDAPPAHRLTDVPWYSAAAPRSLSLTTRMLVAQQGRLEPVAVIDFVTGATWGATPTPRRTGFTPGQDSEPGLRRGATALGFTRRYLTTDDAGAWEAGLRRELAAGRAVRVAVDRNALLERRGVAPHAIVLVGYDVDGFEYYEPWCDEPARCAPGERPAGSAGLRVPAARLRLAAESLSLALQYPWRYQLQVLEPATGASHPLKELLPVHGRALRGTRGGGPSTGAELVLDTARALEQHGDSVLSPELLAGVSLAATVRQENAEALRGLFAERAPLLVAQERLSRAAQHYAAAARALEAKQLPQAVEALRFAAAADREAGDALVDDAAPAP